MPFTRFNQTSLCIKIRCRFYYHNILHLFIFFNRSIYSSLTGVCLWSLFDGVFNQYILNEDAVNSSAHSSRLALRSFIMFSLFYSIFKSYFFFFIIPHLDLVCVYIFSTNIYFQKIVEFLHILE